jgi:hypothetical protein
MVSAKRETKKGKGKVRDDGAEDSVGDHHSYSAAIARPTPARMVPTKAWDTPMPRAPPAPDPKEGRPLPLLLSPPLLDVVRGGMLLVGVGFNPPPPLLGEERPEL